MLGIMQVLFGCFFVVCCFYFDFGFLVCFFCLLRFPILLSKPRFSQRWQNTRGDRKDTRNTGHGSPARSLLATKTSWIMLKPIMRFIVIQADKLNANHCKIINRRFTKLSGMPWKIQQGHRCGRHCLAIVCFWTRDWREGWHDAQIIVEMWW